MSSKRPGEGREEEEPPKKNPRLDSNSTVDHLPQLLDFTTISALPEISNRFDEIAKALLQEYHIYVSCNGTVTELEILECEFYLLKAGMHEDPFTHGSEEQRQSGRWYVQVFVIFSWVLKYNLGTFTVRQHIHQAHRSHRLRLVDIEVVVGKVLT
jgi:hypothetical protein